MVGSDQILQGFHDKKRAHTFAGSKFPSYTAEYGSEETPEVS